MTNTIVVAGAGVTGLTTAMLLSRSKDNNVTVVAKHMPGDYDIEYASPFAGANMLPMSTTENSNWERRTWPELKRLAEEVPEAGIHLQKARVYRRNKDLLPGSSLPMNPLFLENPWYQELMDDYRELNADEVLDGHDSGCEFGSMCINVPVYLSWLIGQCLKNGVVIKRAVLKHIAEAKNLSHTGNPADIIINATSMGSRKLGGVEDATMTPARGQIVVVRNEVHPMVVTSGTNHEATGCLYIMTRAAGGGTIIGGTYDIGNWESIPDPNIAARIMQRAVDLRPEIAGGKGVTGLDVIRHAVGLRPYRPSGVRIEVEKLDDSTQIVHNYGHAGWGYQGSYGCAERAIELVNEIRKAKGDDVASEPPLFTWDAKQ